MAICWTFHQSTLRIFSTKYLISIFVFKDLPNYTSHTTDTTAAELFVNCLEAMVETCLPVEEGDQQIAQYPSMLSVSSTMNLSSSLSSLTVVSPTDKGTLCGVFSLTESQVYLEEGSYELGTIVLFGW